MEFSGRLLEAFLALDETRRFVVAAHRCHVSPSAFSQMIARLEEQVGVKLFDRSTRHVSLTAEGEVFAVGARRIADEIAASIGEMKDRAGRKSGSVTLATPPSLASAWLPERMAGFRARHPDITLKLRDVVSEKCLELVLQGRVDFGLSASHGNELEFESLHLMSEHFYLICRDDDVLAQAQSIRLRQLAGREFIQLIRTGSTWRELQNDLRRVAVRDTGLEVDQFSTVAGLVANGFGIGLVPQFALPVCRRPGLLAIRVSDRGVTRPVYMVRRRGRSLSIAAQSLWDFIRHSERR